MKRRIVLAAFMLTGVFAKAQDLGFGIKAGLNYNIVTMEDVDPSNGFGFHVGPTLDLGLSDILNFRVELLASQQGTTNVLETELLGIKTKVTAKSSPLYLSIPVLYNYKLDGLNLFVGPQFNMLLSNKYSSRTTVNGDAVDALDVDLDRENAKNGMRAFEIGLAIGAEYNLSDNIGLGLRYVRGLQSITDSDNATNFYNIVQLSAIYKF